MLDTAAQVIGEAGFSVIREPMEGIAQFSGQQFDTNYLNWLVGNGFLITTGYGIETWTCEPRPVCRVIFPIVISMFYPC